MNQRILLLLNQLTPHFSELIVSILYQSQTSSEILSVCYAISYLSQSLIREIQVQLFGKTIEYLLKKIESIENKNDRVMICGGMLIVIESFSQVLIIVPVFLKVVIQKIIEMIMNENKEVRLMALKTFKNINANCGMVYLQNNIYEIITNQHIFMSLMNFLDRQEKDDLLECYGTLTSFLPKEYIDSYCSTFINNDHMIVIRNVEFLEHGNTIEEANVKEAINNLKCFIRTTEGSLNNYLEKIIDNLMKMYKILNMQMVELSNRGQQFNSMSI